MALAALQKTIGKDFAMGLPGSIAYDSPIRAQTGIIDWTHGQLDHKKNCFGRIFTRATGKDTWRVGCDPVQYVAGEEFKGEVGLLINPKESVAFSLDPNIYLRFGSIGTFATMGQFFVIPSNPEAIKFDNVLGFVEATGEIITNFTIDGAAENISWKLTKAKVVKYEFGPVEPLKRLQNQVFVMQLTY